MKIKGYLLKDIQSWDDKSGAVSPATDRMNVIIAPSETGKSVVIKVLKEMCFSGQWGYTWSSLIKRGASFGVAVFILEDDTMVCYYIMPFMVKYVLIYPDGNRRIWESKEQNNTEIPEEIAQKMGLIVDRDAKTVINVLDKDMVTPFVTASQEMNARIAKVITAVPEMEKRINTLKEWKYYLDSALVNVKVDYNSSKLGYDRLPSIDVLGLKSKLNKMKILRDFILPVESIVKYFSDKEIPIEPEVVKLPECIEDFLSVMNSINEYCKIADIVKTMVKPKEVVFNEESIGTLITAIKGISELGNQLVVVSKEQKPIEKVNPIDVKEIVDLIKLVTDYGLLLKSYEEPPKLIKAPDSSNSNLKIIRWL